MFWADKSRLYQELSHTEWLLSAERRQDVLVSPRSVEEWAAVMRNSHASVTSIICPLLCLLLALGRPLCRSITTLIWVHLFPPRGSHASCILWVGIGYIPCRIKTECRGSLNFPETEVHDKINMKQTASLPLQSSGNISTYMFPSSKIPPSSSTRSALWVRNH